MNDLQKHLAPFREYLCDQVVLNSPKNKEQTYTKCKIKLIKLKSNTVYQKELYTTTQVFHENLSGEEIIDFITNAMLSDFNQIQWLYNGFAHSIRLSKKNKVLYSKKATEQTVLTPSQHNRKKTYLLPEGDVIPPLVDLGIFTKEGKVVASMYDKYKQINRFLEMIDDVLKHNSSQSLNIIDFGCGKSYLTFIVYHYLNNIKKIPTTITGMDLKEKVIEDCNKISKKYGYENLKFVYGDIADYKSTKPLDIVITLHACDTATDFALYHAVKLNSRAILSVPCCQHEINGQITSSTPTIFTRYGLIKERFSALTTDAIRGNILELMGYHTQLLEFVDLSHSPKNILIRGVRSPKANPTPKQTKQEILDIMSEYKIKPTLYSLLEEEINKI